MWGWSERVLWPTRRSISGAIIRVVSRPVVPPIVVVRRIIVRWVSFAADLSRWGTCRVEGAGRINELVEVSKGDEGECDGQD